MHTGEDATETSGRATAPDLRAVVLVEGPSDEAAVMALAERRGVALAPAGVAVVVAGGATAITPFLLRYGPQGEDVGIVGLCDAGEERYVRRASERAGVPDLPWHVCAADLEDELIRALGTDRVLAVVEAAGELSGFETFSRQPAQRHRDLHPRLHRFIGVRSGRKVRYGRLLVEALDDHTVPAPLEGLLDDVLAS